MDGVFVTGTGTGVGKSIVAASLCAALVDALRTVVASKPLLSGLDEAPDGHWPYDHELLAIASGGDAATIAPRRFGPAVSPHLAARWAGVTLTVDDLAADVRARYAAAAADSTKPPVAVVEGAGGLLVPIDDDGATMADLAADLALPLLVVAHPGLGTINHTLLTLEAAASRGLPVAGIVLTPWAAQPTAIEADNRAYLEKSTGLPIFGLPPVESPHVPHLSAAAIGAGLHHLL